MYEKSKSLVFAAPVGYFQMKVETEWNVLNVNVKVFERVLNVKSHHQSTDLLFDRKFKLNPLSWFDIVARQGNNSSFLKFSTSFLTKLLPISPLKISMLRM